MPIGARAVGFGMTNYIKKTGDTIDYLWQEESGYGLTKAADFIIFKDGDVYYALQHGKDYTHDTDAYTVIKAALDALSAGQSLYVAPVTYNLTTKLTISTDGISIFSNGLVDPFGLATESGAIFKDASAGGLTDIIEITANGVTLDNILLHGNAKASNGLRLTACRYCVFPHLSIERCESSGLVIDGSGANICADHWFGDLRINLPSDTSTDLRAIIFDGGTSTGGATCNYFDRVTIVVYGATTSYGIDFKRRADNNYFGRLQIGQVSGTTLTACVIFNSADPTSNNLVHNNTIAHFSAEVGASVPQIIANKADRANRVYTFIYNIPNIRGYSENLEIVSMLRRYEWSTFFESADGFWTPTSGSGSVTLASDKVTVATGATSGSTAEIIKNPARTFFSWGRRRVFKTRVRFVTNTNQEIRIATGLNRTATQDHLGFKVVNGDLYGSVADGTTESTVDTGVDISAGDVVELEAHFLYGIEARFYVNGVDKGSIATNLPDGGGNVLMSLYIENTEAADKSFEISEFKVESWQE